MPWENVFFDKKTDKKVKQFKNTLADLTKNSIFVN